MRVSEHTFVLPYAARPYDLPLADWDPRCPECGEWPTDCLCNALSYRGADLSNYRDRSE